MHGNGVSMDTWHPIMRRCEMGKLGDIYRRHVQESTLPGYKEPSLRDTAKLIGVTASTLGRWRDGEISQLPRPEHLQAAARVFGVPYQHVVRAALIDAGYFPADPDPSPGVLDGVRRDLV